jgi:hypothetical protein
MSAERRFNDDEVAAIFEAASNTPASRHEEPAPQQGLTLAELQAIGKEVGIAPERIAHAAASVAQLPPPLPRRRDLGMPVTAAHVVELPRALTDREWSLLVSDLREIFSARGTDSSRGETRQWSNSNLHAVVEPTRTGWRLRLGTMKADGLALNRVSLMGLAMAAVVTVAVGGNPEAFGGVVMLGSIGAGALILNAVRLPRWAKLREQQMQEVGHRALALIGSSPRTEPTTD